MTEQKYIEGIMGCLVREAFDLGRDEECELNQRAALILAKAGYALFELLLDMDIPASVAMGGNDDVH